MARQQQKREEPVYALRARAVVLTKSRLQGANSLPQAGLR